MTELCLPLYLSIQKPTVFFFPDISVLYSNILILLNIGEIGTGSKTHFLIKLLLFLNICWLFMSWDRNYGFQQIWSNITIPNVCVGRSAGESQLGPQHARQQLYHPLHPQSTFYSLPLLSSRWRCWIKNIIISIITKPFKTRNKKNLED